MAGVAIWVEFTVRPGAFCPFHELVTANAAASLRDEPGCRQFDVLVPDDGAGHDVALYEIYDDAAAFDAHLQTRHFRDFDAASADLVEHKAVRRYRLSDAA